MQDLCLELVEAGGLDMDAAYGTRLRHMHQLVCEYADLPMDFADASLVALAEKQAMSPIFTFEDRDFRIYAP